jgi:sugar lactone lactonase YvrE
VAERSGAIGLPALLATLGLAVGACLPYSKPVDEPAAIYPPAPDLPRVQFVKAINTSADVMGDRQGLAALVFGAKREIEKKDVLVKPYGVAVHNGRIYVCDQRNADVKIFDVNARAFSLLSGRKQVLAAPTGICIAEDGYKFVIESMAAKISVFDPSDNFVTTFKVMDIVPSAAPDSRDENGKKEEPEMQGRRPKGPRPGGAVAIGGELFVTDVTGGRVLVLDRSTGKLVRTLGSPGEGPGQFLMPNAIAKDAEGNLYVCDHLNFRWQRIDRVTGKPLLVAGEAGDVYGTFSRPRGTAVGPDGIVHVVDSRMDIVQMFNPQGKVLMGYGNYRAAPGFLELPAGIAIDTSCLPYFRKLIHPCIEPEYLIFVVSQVGGARLGVYAYGKPVPGVERPSPPIPKAPTPKSPSPTPPASPAAPGSAPAPATPTPATPKS